MELPNPLLRVQRLAVVCAVCVFTAIAAIAIANWADAATVRVLGAGPPQKPSCPDPNDACIVEARVTGFQTKLGRIRKPFVAPYPGRVVAWSIKLGRPSAKDNRCFSSGCEVGDNQMFKGFGGPASARLAVLRPVRSKIKAGKPVYELMNQSPVEVLTPYFGTTTTFTLQRPLKMKRGWIAALTVPTWAPMFVKLNSTDYAWRASRVPTKRRGGCTVGSGGSQGANVDAGSPHQKVGVERRYACVYKTNRLLYSATMVKRPRSG